MRWGRRATMPRFPNKIKDFYPPPPDFDLYVGARGVFDGAAADLAARSANGDLDFQQWLAVRRLQIYENAEDAFAGALSQRAAQLPFVRRARVELQTSLGGRKGAGGVDVAGALRETDDDIVGWQLRAYAAEHGSKGLNTGLFYRRVVGGALAGVNVFADYEDGDDGDFWRWSVGGDVKNRLGELSANRYFALTDAQVVGGENVYTREGYDVDFAVRIPRLEWAKARVGYYNFKGEFGDEDENGFRAGLDLSPGAGLVVGVEYDDDDGKFGGNISYTHNFGETQRGAQRAGEFNPRAHFYDVVRREYSQRISRAGNAANGALIVNSGVNVDVRGDVNFTATSFAANAVTNFAFPLTGNAVTVQTQGSSGTLAMRHQGGGWVLTLSNNAQVAFLQTGAVLSVASGGGAFERFGVRRLSAVIMANTTLGLIGTKFDFRADGANAFVTLIDGALSLSVGGNVSVTVLDAPGPGTRVYLYDSGGGSVVVGCGAGEVRATAGLTADCKPTIGVVFVGGADTAPVTTTGGITIGTLQVTGGFDAQDINIVGARGDFRLLNVDDAPTLRALVLGGDNNSARAATVVVRGDDNESKTPAAMLTVVVSVMERVALLGGGRYTVFAIDPDSATVVTFRPAGGTPAPEGYGNQRAVNLGTYTGLSWLNSGGKTSYIARNGADDTPGASYIFISEVSDTRDTVQATATVTVIASLNAAIDFAGGALTAGMAATVATISAAGGVGVYAYSANNNAVSFVEGTIAVARLNNAGTVSVNLIANDNAAITEPFTIVITLTALNAAMAAPDVLTIREVRTGASVTLANLTYSGATGGDNVTATVITVQNGAGEVGGRELLVSSDARGTSEVQVAVYDSANAAAPDSTLTLSVEFVAPLTAAFAGNPNFAPMTTDASNIVIGTVVLSGGDGDYQNPRFGAGGADLRLQSQSIVALVGDNRAPRTVTALIVADDGSGISEQASLAVSVVVFDPLDIPGNFVTTTLSVRVTPSQTLVVASANLTMRSGANLFTTYARFLVTVDAEEPAPTLTLNRNLAGEGIADRPGGNLGRGGLRVPGGQLHIIPSGTGPHTVIVGNTAVISSIVNSVSATLTIGGEDIMPTVTVGENMLTIGRFMLDADGDTGGISASLATEGFTLAKDGDAYNLMLLPSAQPQPRDQLVTVFFTDTAVANSGRNVVFTVRIKPLPVSVGFAGGLESAPLTMAGDIFIGTVEVTNGYRAANISFAGANNGFRLDADDAGNRRLLYLGGDNTNARMAAVTIQGNDNESETDDAFVTVVVTVAGVLTLEGGGRHTILADTNAMPIFTIAAVGGIRGAGYVYATLEEPSGNVAGISVQGDGPFTFNKTETSQTAGDNFQWVFEATDNNTPAANKATTTVQVTVIDGISFAAGAMPPLLMPGSGRGAVTVGAPKTLGALGASGGLSNYVFGAGGMGASLANMSVMVAHFSEAATVTLHYTVDDRDSNNMPVPATPPVTYAITVTALASLDVGGVEVIVTAGSSGNHTRGVVTMVSPSGGHPPYIFRNPILNSDWGTQGFVDAQGAANADLDFLVQMRANGNIVLNGSAVPNRTGTITLQAIGFKDSSTPPRVFAPTAFISLILTE